MMQEGNSLLIQCWHRFSWHCPGVLPGVTYLFIISLDFVQQKSQPLDKENGLLNKNADNISQKLSRMKTREI